MAQLLQASIYGADSYDWNAPMGVLRGFPTDEIAIEPLRTPTAYSGVTCNSIISLLPTGLQTTATKFYTPTATDALISAANS